MSKNSILDLRKFVPEYYGNNREFQVFLRLANVILSDIKADTDNFIPNLLDPLKCKTRLLPLLCNYVGYDYNPRERVITNRWIAKVYPLLVRNRGSELGITLAISLAICIMTDNIETFNLEKHFSMEFGHKYNKYGKKIRVLKIYSYYNDFIPILQELLEIVRPAGLCIEFIPSINISSSETVVLTDEHLIAKYDYVTGKLLSINNTNIYIRNSWPLLTDEKYSIEEEKYTSIPGLSPKKVTNSGKTTATIWGYTGVNLVDGRFFDAHGNDIGKFVDETSGKILNVNDSWDGYFIKETRIYKRDLYNNTEKYTGIYFDVSNPAKIMNTYYEMFNDTVSTGFYLSEDNYCIYDKKSGITDFKLVDYELIDGVNRKNVWKIYDVKTNIKYNWHVDKITRQFIRDIDGEEPYNTHVKLPFSDTTYIDKKPRIMKINTSSEISSDYLTGTKYFVNKFGDIIDLAGNIILSKKDRYKISDSTMIGFSEVHNDRNKLSTYDGTNILNRKWSFIKDNHIQDIHGRKDSTDYSKYVDSEDPRYKFTYYDFDIGKPTREYNGHEEIRFISSEELAQMYSTANGFEIDLFTLPEDSENSSGKLKINVNIPNNYSLADVFNNIRIKYENKIPNNELNPYWDIFIEWSANDLNSTLFNLNDLPNPIHLLKCGNITKRTLHWTKQIMHISEKMYDGTNKMYTKNSLVNVDYNILQHIINSKSGNKEEI